MKDVLHEEWSKRFLSLKENMKLITNKWRRLMKVKSDGKNFWLVCWGQCGQVIIDGWWESFATFITNYCRICCTHQTPFRLQQLIILYCVSGLYIANNITKCSACVLSVCTMYITWLLLHMTYVHYMYDMSTLIYMYRYTVICWLWLHWLGLHTANNTTKRSAFVLSVCTVYVTWLFITYDICALYIWHVHYYICTL